MKSALVTGGAGFIGAHLCQSLCRDGYQVTALDNFYSSDETKIEKLKQEFPQNFTFIHHDVRVPFSENKLQDSGVQEIYHLACPASPPAYGKDQLFTLETSVLGIKNFLDLAVKIKARFLLTSTSEIYGDPMEHPQNENYRGNVNTFGPRACYDEGKRVGETLCYIYRKIVDVRVCRIFNTYGPGMHAYDGRVITNFFQSLKNNQPLPIYGSGKQTRSFCYISDMVQGIRKLMGSTVEGPINLGNPREISILELAQVVSKIAGREFKTIHSELPQDDPHLRNPVIERAKKELQWQPQVSLESGLLNMYEEFLSSNCS